MFRSGLRRDVRTCLYADNRAAAVRVAERGRGCILRAYLRRKRTQTFNGRFAVRLVGGRQKGKKRHTGRPLNDLLRYRSELSKVRVGGRLIKSRASPARVSIGSSQKRSRPLYISFKRPSSPGQEDGTKKRFYLFQMCIYIYM